MQVNLKNRKFSSYAHVSLQLSYEHINDRGDRENEMYFFHKLHTTSSRS